ncbi:MAG: hydrogenase maturation nickel metallochaperone HypA [Anaerolineae bacterium]|nr:MAG: hydrogenase maturation nickel metallochaperone HypA [Anaerolineae bacterium]
MHELMITESLLEIALRYAEKEEATKITDLFLVVGELSSVVDDSVGFYWDFICNGSIAEGASLHFKRIPAELACLDCGYRFSPQENITCDLCDSTRIKIMAGKEFYLESIEITQDESKPDDAFNNASHSKIEQGSLGD